MRSLQRLVILTIATVASTTVSGYGSVAGSSKVSAKPDIVAFLHAAVIPMDRERTLYDQSVIVSNGRIVAIGNTSKIKVPADALRIDLAADQPQLLQAFDQRAGLVGQGPVEIAIGPAERAFRLLGRARHGLAPHFFA